MSKNLDQELAAFRDTVPAVWMALYNGCQSVGFTREQSFALLCTWIIGQNPTGIRPNNDPSPPTKEDDR